MSAPSWLEVWILRHGGRTVLILLVVMSLLQILRLWRGRIW